MLLVSASVKLVRKTLMKLTPVGLKFCVKVLKQFHQQYWLLIYFAQKIRTQTVIRGKLRLKLLLKKIL